MYHRPLTLLLLIMGATFTWGAESPQSDAPASAKPGIVTIFNYYYVVRTIDFSNFPKLVSLAGYPAKWHNASTGWHGGIHSSWYGEKKHIEQGGKPLKLGRQQILGNDDTPPAAMLILQSWPDRGKDKEALDHYLALCKQSGTRVVLAITPTQLAWNPRTIPVNYARGKTREDASKRVAQTYSRHDSLMKKLTHNDGITVIPTHRAFKAFYDAQPEMELNQPSGDSNHLGPYSSYLIACTFAATLGTKRPNEDAFPSDEELFKKYNSGVDKYNEKAKSRNKPLKERVSTTPAWRKAVHDAAWTAVAEWQTEVKQTNP